jgi:hypothetical protein
MAKDYLSTYRQLQATGTLTKRTRQLALNGGNGLAAVSIEPVPVLIGTDE